MTIVFKYKNINLNVALGCATLFTTFVFHNLNSVSAEVTTKRLNNVVNVADNEIETNTDIVAENIQKLVSFQTVSNYSNLESIGVPGNLNSQETISQEKPLNISYRSFKTAININKDETAGSNLRIVRIVSLSFFLSLFVPFGIFYPFFIFYKNLLGVEDKELNQTGENDDISFPVSSFNLRNFNPENYHFIKEEDNLRSTVSKLQIAFSPQASTLKQQLSQISSSVDGANDRGVIDLMSKTISVLIDQKYFTHVSHSSISLPFSQVKDEFDLISCSERNKCMSEELSLVNSGGYRERSATSRDQDFYSYIIVTLILCTTNNSPLFNKILTKEKLLEELVKLGRMRKDNLLKFELLWNPQGEDKYINNNKLLREYGDMNRLF